MQRRNTENKKRILALFQKSHALGPKEICRLLPDIETSTVYRNIERFVADGLLREIHVHSGITTYEYVNDVHNHFVCNDCNSVEELEVREKAIETSLPTGAIMNNGGVVVRGTCGACIKK